jgi:ABC-type glycerol-3-phosphate transport system substrate-binding protein
VGDLSAQLFSKLSFRGRLLVWHTWEESDSLVLESFFDSFMDVHPGVRIVSEYVPPDQLRERFNDRISAGLGPDLLIGPDLGFVRELVDLDALVDLSEFDLETQLLLPRAVNALRMDEGLYGLPLAAHTNVLYYNKNLVETPAATLDDLILAARDGQVIAIPVDFHEIYWGVRAFGDDLMDEGGQIKVGEGFTAWAAWLIKAQEEPAIIFSRDEEDLYQLFSSGRAAYYIGDSTLALELRDALGEENLGVALIPRNAANEDEESIDPIMGGQPPVSDGGFLEFEAIVLNKLSTEQWLDIQLAEFLVNPVHQRQLTAADLGQIPISSRVRFDPRISEAETIMIRQSSNTATTPLVYIRLEESLAETGNEIYTQLLEGVLTPEEATEQMMNKAWKLSYGGDSAQ